MKIIAIKTNEGYLISDNIENKNYTNSFLGSFLFDGFLPEKTYNAVVKEYEGMCRLFSDEELEVLQLIQ